MDHLGPDLESDVDTCCFGVGSQAGAVIEQDLVVPYVDERGRASDPWFTPWSWFGYRFELDAEARLGRRSVDWPALATALAAIQRAAAREGLEIERLYLAPELQPALLAEGRAAELGELPARLNARRAWWRHDEHLHLDFRPIAGP